MPCKQGVWRMENVVPNALLPSTSVSPCRCGEKPGLDAFPLRGNHCDSGFFAAHEDCSSCPQDCGSCCGNGVVDGSEECDTGGESATCDDDCTWVSCGDDILNTSAGEECEPPGGECCDTTCQFEPAGSTCDDSNPCTDDACDGAGTCEHADDDTNDCDDGLFCSGAEHCESGVCVSSGDPCIGGGECRQTCDEAEDNCLDPAGAFCGDGPTECSEQNTCDGSGNCDVNDLPVGTDCGDPSDTPCDDPDTCDGSGTCLANYAPSGMPCTVF